MQLLIGSHSLSIDLKCDTPACIVRDTPGAIVPRGFSVNEITPKHRTDASTSKHTGQPFVAWPHQPLTVSALRLLIFC